MDEARRLQHELFKDMPASWHAAIDAGHDMALVYEAMQRSFEERLEDLGRAQAMLGAVRGASVLATQNEGAASSR